MNFRKMYLSLWLFTITWIRGSSVPAEDKCPPYQEDVICKRHINNCEWNSDCPIGQICCTVECGRNCSPPTQAICELPMEIGPCDAAIIRYFYNTNTKSCQPFIYGGCLGNANNFETLEDCRRKCEKSSIAIGIDPCLTAPKCALPPPGICFEPTYKIIDGVKCHWCYKIVPCEPELV